MNNYISLSRFFQFLFVLSCTVFSLPSLAKDCVILLHGLARTDASFTVMAESLREQHYHVVNYHYPSTHYPVEVLANTHIYFLRKHTNENPVINHLGRVVMLGPPNHGSEVVDKLSKLPGFYWINGPAGMQLGTDATSLPNTLGGVNYDVGIIAGTRSINWLLSMLIPSVDDGKVSVNSTKLEGMSDHMTMPVTHPLMMRNTLVIEQVIYFLKNKRFDLLLSRISVSSATLRYYAAKRIAS